jgi:hypothetical protein
LPPPVTTATLLASGVFSDIGKIVNALLQASPGACGTLSGQPAGEQLASYSSGNLRLFNLLQSRCVSIILSFAGER